jgi:MFS family permease
MLKMKRSSELKPIYLAAFLQSFVFWYSIEKIFMNRIGLNYADIGFIVAIYSLVSLVLDTPTGVLADKWGRKYVLIIAGLFLSVSSYLGGLSHNFESYTVAVIFWSVFFACYSGMYDSLIYDALKSKKSTNERTFERSYSHIQVLEAVAGIASALLGGYIASHYSLREPYFLSVPLGLLSVVALLFYEEPQHYKENAVGQRFKTSFNAVMKNKSSRLITITMMLRYIITFLLFEFSQLWLISLHTPIKFYGLANAILASSIGVGAFIAARINFHRSVFVYMAILLELLSSLGLVIFHYTLLIVAAQFVLGSVLYGLRVTFTATMHNNFESSIRAGASSFTNTLSAAIGIPIAILFGYICQETSVYKASYLILILVVIMVYTVRCVSTEMNKNELR